jgi:ketosteroid isomerase-like protein
MTDTEASRRLVLDYFRAMGADDQPTLARVLADDVEWVPQESAPLEGRPYVGRDTVVAAMHREGSRFFDLSTSSAEIKKIVADGDTVVVLHHFSCTTQSGRPYSNNYVLVFTCAGGQIVRIDEHTDTLRFSRIVLDP